MSAELLAETLELRNSRLRTCNDLGRSLASEAQGAMKQDCEDVLAMDIKRLMTLSMDLTDAIFALRAAHNSYEALRRRGH